MDYTTLFIGAGNMSQSIIGGMITSGFPKDKITALDKSTPTCEKVKANFQINCLEKLPDNLVADLIVLAVKPQQLKEVCLELAPKIQGKNPLILSIAAGITTQSLDKWLGGNQAIVRSMPNTPALVQQGATGYFANPLVSAIQLQQAQDLLATLGLALEVKTEAELDLVTAISGSGPAYFFLFMEAMQAAGEKLGLPAETAQKLTLQTALGAGVLASKSSESFAELRKNVTSPNGTTAKAIESFQTNKLDEIVELAVLAAKNRAAEMAQELGE